MNNRSKQLQQLNPNWALLQQKLKSQSSKPSKPPENSFKDTLKTSLGKRKHPSNVESDNSRLNPLNPTTTDSSITDEIAMDCEMVGVGSQGHKSALGRVSLVNKWGNVIYDEYVRPVEYVVDFRTDISGIRPRDLRKAKNFRMVQKEVAELLQGRILVGHALRNDLKALLLSHPKKDVRDTSEYQPLLKEGRRKALRHLAAEYLGVKIQDGEHCPIEDARAAMLLYQRNKKRWEKSIKDRMKLNQKKSRTQRKKPKEENAFNFTQATTLS